jgi:hypothetical protein
VPALPWAAADPGVNNLEKPDEEQDDDDQGEDATTDVHRIALLSVVDAGKDPDVPGREGVHTYMRARGLEPLRAFQPNGT